MSGTVTPTKNRSLAPWRAPLTSLRSEMEEMLSRFWGEGEETWLSGVNPSVDISENEKAVEVRMDLPGVKPNEINIQLHQNILTVSGERKEDKEEKGKTYHRVERRTGRFSRSFPLPCPVAEDEVVAAYQDGTLTITLPKCEKSEPRKITVKS